MPIDLVTNTLNVSWQSLYSVLSFHGDEPWRSQQTQLTQNVIHKTQNMQLEYFKLQFLFYVAHVQLVARAAACFHVRLGRHLFIESSNRRTAKHNTELWATSNAANRKPGHMPVIHVYLLIRHMRAYIVFKPKRVAVATIPVHRCTGDFTDVLMLACNYRSMVVKTIKNY